MSATNALLAEIMDNTKATAKEVATMKTKLKAVVAYKDLKDKEDLLYKAKSVAGINQEAA